MQARTEFSSSEKKNDLSQNLRSNCDDQALYINLALYRLLIFLMGVSIKKKKDRKHFHT